MDNQKMYDEKVARLRAAINLEKTDHVPVLSMAQTWAISYAGTNAKETFTSLEHEFEVYSKYLKEIYFDGTLIFGMNRPLDMYNALGYSPFFFSDDGITIQHKDNSVLPEDEIDELIVNPLLYLRNKVLYRRFPKLQQAFPNDLEALGSALQEFLKAGRKMEIIPEYLRDNVGTPLVMGELMEPALDRYICYRGFRNGMNDLRTRPEKVLEAVEAIYPLVMPAPMPRADFPWVFFPILSPTNISRKNFEKFFWPTFKRAIERLNELGGKALIGMEGSWEHVYDYLLDLPKKSAVVTVERGDIIKVKKEVGHHLAVGGGMPVSLLKNGTKQECVDHVRNVIDSCGDAGLIMCTDIALLSPGDVNAENLRASTEFIRDYRIQEARYGKSEGYQRAIRDAQAEYAHSG